MKIYKISQNYNMIQQNPGIAPNLDSQLTNLQNSQSALNFLGNIGLWQMKFMQI